MQGSPISPYLFDIYVETLIEKIRNEGALREECVIMYADDLAVVCYNELNMRKVIEIIKEWSGEKGLSINKKKSGILQVLGKRQKITLQIDNIRVIPIVKSYKYLGINIYERLAAEKHREQMKPNILYLIYRLKWVPSPLTSIRFTANMWHVFIRPLIESCLYFNIVNTKHKDFETIKWARTTFKSMCGLTKTTKNVIRGPKKWVYQSQSHFIIYVAGL